MKDGIMTKEEKHEKLIKMLLCLLFGNWGMHHFYLGNNRAVYYRLSLTICGLLTFGITTIIASILTLKDFITITMDKELKESKIRSFYFVIGLFIIICGCFIGIAKIQEQNSELKQERQFRERQTQEIQDRIQL